MFKQIGQLYRNLMAQWRGSFQSNVPGHHGVCYPTWIDGNLAVRRLEGPGVGGFFRLVSGGPEFHGVVWTDGQVWSTLGVYSTFRGPDSTVSKLLCSCHFDAKCPECNGEGETRMTVRERSLGAQHG